MDNVLRYLIIVLMVIAGIALVAVCGDSLCGECGHSLWPGVDRSRAIHRLARRLYSACASALALALMQLAIASRAAIPTPSSSLCVSPFVKVSALRI
jgi:hypothetical protein